MPLARGVLGHLGRENASGEFQPKGYCSIGTTHGP